MLSVIIHIACIVLSAVAFLFILSLIVYFFNLDMKAAAIMEKIMTKHYDRMKRNRKF